MRVSLIIFFLGLFQIFSIPTWSQQDLSKEIIGIWQAGDSTNGSAWLDSYQFFENGEFIFNFDQYKGSKRILSLYGKFRLKHDTLITSILKQRELIGGHIERGGNGSESEWVLVGAKEEFIFIRKERVEQASISNFYQTENGRAVMKLHGRLYYRLDRNPHNY